MASSCMRKKPSNHSARLGRFNTWKHVRWKLQNRSNKRLKHSKIWLGIHEFSSRLVHGKHEKLFNWIFPNRRRNSRRLSNMRSSNARSRHEKESKTMELLLSN